MPDGPEQEHWDGELPSAEDLVAATGIGGDSADPQKLADLKLDESLPTAIDTIVKLMSDSNARIAFEAAKWVAATRGFAPTGETKDSEAKRWEALNEKLAKVSEGGGE